jgi:7-cyano-7-deazaguanine synthase
MKKVVLLSGGLDSSTCLACALQGTKPEDILAVNMYYGQKHEREMQSARKIAAFYGVELMELDLSMIFSRSDCSLLKGSNNAIPEGDYASQQADNPGKPVSTYVPFRNGLMLSAAASIAVSVGAYEIWYGAHADDAAGNAYPDCSPEFTGYMDSAIYFGTDRQVRVIAPFIKMNKAAIVKEGLKLGVPYEMTWSCYNGGDMPCGKCGTCIDRIKAFEANGAADPLQYKF